jgi:hypothetical protein
MRAHWSVVLALFLPACGGDEPAPRSPAASPTSAPASVPAAADSSPTSTPGSRPAPARRDLIDEANARGLDYLNRSGEPAKRTVLEANGAGVAVLDIHGDGDLDLVFTQGCASLAALLKGPGADLEIFHNDGAGRFERAAGPGLSGWWNGVVAGDLDNDGDADLVAGGFGALRVLLQNESGEFVLGPDLMPSDPHARLTPGEAREAGHPPLWVTSLALLDAERDGVLDLYVGQYLELDPVAPPLGKLGSGPLAAPCQWKGYEVFCGPHGMKPQPDRFLRGVGDGTFVDDTSRALPGHVAGFTLAMAPFDFEGDGDSDLYVANDSVANLLLINDGRGVFTDVAYSAGVAVSMDGRAEAGMGVAFGDVDRDGDQDFALTNFSGEPTALYFANVRGFSNETFRFGLQRESRALLSWSVHLTDFDGDGWLELFTSNGHVYPQADLADTGTSYGQRATLWKLSASGAERTLTRVDASGPESVLAAPLGARGTAVGDFDGDGAPDLVLNRIDGPAALGMNRFGAANRLVVRCVGPLRSESAGGASVGRTSADALGARVVLVPAVERGGQEHALLARVDTSVGYQSSSTPWLHFGLGEAKSYTSLRVFWPSGVVEDLGAGAAGRRITIKEGRGVVREEKLP